MKWPKLVKSFTQSTSVSVSIELDGIDEDGAPLEGVSYTGYGNYQDHAGKVFSAEKTEEMATGTIYFDGDIAEDLAVISGGTVTVLGEVRRIVQGMKGRNPDGTVNYTRLDVV